MDLTKIFIKFLFNIFVDIASEDPLKFYMRGKEKSLDFLRQALLVNDYSDNIGCGNELPGYLSKKLWFTSRETSDMFLKTENIYKKDIKCKGTGWVKGDGIVYVCDCGFEVPVVMTNLPNVYKGDYDNHGKRVLFDSEGFVCPYLKEKGFTFISPLEAMKMSKRGEL